MAWCMRQLAAAASSQLHGNAPTAALRVSSVQRAPPQLSGAMRLMRAARCPGSGGQTCSDWGSCTTQSLRVAKPCCQQGPIGICCGLHQHGAQRPLRGTQPCNAGIARAARQHSTGTTAASSRGQTAAQELNRCGQSLTQAPGGCLLASMLLHHVPGAARLLPTGALSKAERHRAEVCARGLWTSSKACGQHRLCSSNARGR